MHTQTNDNVIVHACIKMDAILLDSRECSYQNELQSQAVAMDSFLLVL